MRCNPHQRVWRGGEAHPLGHPSTSAPVTIIRPYTARNIVNASIALASIGPRKLLTGPPVVPIHERRDPTFSDQETPGDSPFSSQCII